MLELPVSRYKSNSVNFRKGLTANSCRQHIDDSIEEKALIQVRHYLRGDSSRRRVRRKKKGCARSVQFKRGDAVRRGWVLQEPVEVGEERPC